MKYRFVIALIVVASFIIITQPAIADDLADLKATEQKYAKAWNSSDLNTVFEIWQEGGIWLPTSRSFPVVTNNAMGKQMFTKFLESHIYWRDWYKVDYKIIGNTGLVWGLTQTVVVVKATGTGKRYYNKCTMVFVKSEGKWVAVMSHDTPIQPDADIY